MEIGTNIAGASYQAMKNSQLHLMLCRVRQPWMIFKIMLVALFFAFSAQAATHNSSRLNFDHDKTLFQLNGVHNEVKCEECHLRGVFKGTPRDCAGCHNSGFLPNSISKPANHIPTNLPCSNCHTTTNWQNATFDHTGIAPGSCATCHNGGITTGKPANHIPTTQSCDACHKSTKAWTPAGFDHTGVTPGTCVTCHDGVRATGKPTNHIFTTQACDVCHRTAAWIPAGFDHAGQGIHVGDHSCATCHGVSATGKPSGHIGTSAACDVCHVSTVSWYTGNFDHAAAGISGNCSSCHDNRKAVGKPSTTHIPTTLECNVCHAGMPLTKTSFAGGVMDHQGITTACSQCHNNRLATGKPSGHIPTTASCEVCHNGTAPSFNTWGGGQMNHSVVGVGSCASCHNGSIATGKSAKHIPTSLSCDACHAKPTLVVASFTWKVPLPFSHAGVTPGSCSTCHNGAYAGVKNMADFASHIPTKASCDTCHTTGYVSFASAKMNHLASGAAASGGCLSCHNGAYSASPNNAQGTAQYTPGPHIATTASCDACHTSAQTKSFTSFAGGGMSHAGVKAGSCASCHDGVQAKGVTFAPFTHIPTTVACDTCHTNTSNYTVWGPNTAMNHVGIASGNCNSCHIKGNQYTGYSGLKTDGSYANHITFGSVQCDTCHTAGFATFAGGKMNHSSVSANIGSGGCSTCHNGTKAQGISAYAKHITAASMKTAQCDACHTAGFISFAGGGMSHAAVGAALGSGGCSTCHNGTNAMGKNAFANHTTTTLECDSCHTAGGFTTFAGGGMNHAAAGITIGSGGCSTCHNGTKAQGISAYAKHITAASMGSAQCDACHTAGFVSFAGGEMKHSAVGSTLGAGGCITCHNGTNAMGKSAYPTHLSTTAQCDTCHISGGFTTFAGAGMNHAAAGISIGKGGCSTCHNGTAATGISAYAKHISTASMGATQCDACHTSGFSSFAGGAMNHIAVGSTIGGGGCNTCHNGNIAVGTAAFATHITTTAQCDSCHTTGGFTSFAGGIMNHAAVGASIHNPAGSTGAGACSTCHDNTHAMGKAAYATHVNTSAQCDVCHTSLLSFASAQVSHASFNPPVVFGTTNCATCHNGTTALGAASYPNHVTVGSNNCTVCHQAATTKSYISWAGGNYPHTASAVGQCNTCHNGTTATGTTSYTKHINVTGVQCDQCHTPTYTSNYSVWGPGTPMNHTAVGLAAVGGRCQACHNGTNALGTTSFANHLSTTASCDVCHKSASSLSYKDWTGGKYHTYNTVTTGSCNDCHAGTYTSSGAQSYTTYTNHVPFGAAKCDVCHANTSNYTVWGPGTPMNHVAAGYPYSGGQCTTCHNGSRAKGVTAFASHIPTGSASCEVCHKTSTTVNFVDWVGGKYHGNNVATAGACNTCHLGAYVTSGAQSTASFAGHVAIGSTSCDVCHTSAQTKAFTSFAGGSMAHNVSMAGQCQTCHNGTLAQGMSVYPNHVATTASCDSCHTQAVSKGYTTWATGIMVHNASMAGKCQTCHNGIQAQGMTTFANHMSTTASCDVCHKASATTTYTGWAGGKYHAYNVSAAGGCSTCHMGQLSSSGALAPSSYANHVSSGSTSCDVCHTSAQTKAFTSFAGASMSHNPTMAGQCQTCHNGTIAQGTSVFAKHISYTGSCDTCHKSAATAAYTAWTGGKYHGNVAAGTCTNCHNGSYVNGSTVLGTANFLPGPHVPSTGITCDACHTNTSNYTAWGPGTLMNHSSTSQLCSACHGAATYKSSATSGVKMWKGDFASHVNTLLECNSCHTTVNWLGATFNHASNGITVGSHNCSTCHNGSTATGMSSFAKHIPTTSQCDYCHTSAQTSAFTSFAGGVMQHTGVSGLTVTNNCSTCHNGTQATGKPGTHTPTTAQCDSCHTPTNTQNFTTFTGAGFNHAAATPAVAGRCNTCHNGTTATGISAYAKHITTASMGSAQCDQCHQASVSAGYNNFSGGVMNHAAVGMTVAGQCAVCHNGSNAQGANTGGFNHFSVVGISCDQCHTSTSNYTVWGPGTKMNHSATSLVTATKCNTCHAGTYNYATAMTGTAISCKSASCGSASLHMPVTAASCDSCHTSTTNWTVYAFTHNGITTSPCATCHNGTYANFGTKGPGPNGTGTGASGVPTKHIPISAVGSPDCGACHSSTAIPNGWATEKMAHGSNGTGTQCTTCHVTGTSYLGTMQKKSLTHQAANYYASKTATTSTPDTDCDNCHKPGTGSDQKGQTGGFGTLFSSWN